VLLIPLVLGKKSDAAQAPAESVERLLNAYLESAPTGKEPTPIYGTPGLTAWATGLDGATRGMLEMGEITYTVNGNRLYSFTSAGVPFLSALADPTSYDALDFASAEAVPDVIVTVFVHHKILYLFGKVHIEAQQNTGGADFPYAPYNGINIDVGLAGRDAVCHTNDAMFFQAHDDTIRRIDGITATKISTARISKIISGWSDKTATVASAHVWADHLFVVFHNPDGCIVWDQNNSSWHERASYGSDTWKVRHFAECYDLKLFGSATEGKIYRLDADTYSEDGAILPFEITTPYAYAANKRLTVSDLEVVCQTGGAPLGLDPKITLERTRDGQTWSDRKSRSLGKTGERSKRVTFGVQGSGRAMAFRIGIYDAVQRAVLGLYAEIDVEP
jgi:hypothetical protein